jgi:hypothetical protein
MTASSTMSIFTLVDLLWATFWDRFPNLKFSLTEGDVGWIPYFLWRAEHVHERHSGWTQHEFPPGGPRQIFNEHILCCFIGDAVSVKLLDEFNLDNLCWESDYPHSDSSWPYGPESLEKLFTGVPDGIVNKITHENAMRHYQFDPFSIRPREKCTAAALRAESPDVDVVTRVGRLADDRDLERWQQITTAARPTEQ